MFSKYRSSLSKGLRERLMRFFALGIQLGECASQSLDDEAILPELVDYLVKLPFNVIKQRPILFSKSPHFAIHFFSCPLSKGENCPQ